MNDNADARHMPVQDIIAALEAARIAIGRITSLPRRNDDADPYRRGLFIGYLLSDAQSANAQLAALINSLRMAHGNGDG